MKQKTSGPAIASRATTAPPPESSPRGPAYWQARINEAWARAAPLRKEFERLERRASREPGARDELERARLAWSGPLRDEIHRLVSESRAEADRLVREQAEAREHMTDALQLVENESAEVNTQYQSAFAYFEAQRNEKRAAAFYAQNRRMYGS